MVQVEEDKFFKERNNKMEEIQVSLPFSDEELDKYFDNIESYYFLIDLKNSSYKNSKILTYIYNSGMNCDILLDNFDCDLEELALEYVKTDKLMNLSSLNELWVTILIASINKSYFQTKNEEYKKFISDFISTHQDIINEILLMFTSLKSMLIKTLLNDIDGDNEKKITKKFTQIGRNVISLRNSINFWNVFALLEYKEDYENYEEFHDNSFEGKKIAFFFINEFNPLSLIYMGRFLSEEEKNKYYNDMCKYLE